MSVLARLLHPSKPWKDKYVNNYDKAQATDHGVIGREEKLIRRRLINCVLVSHANFPGQVFHVALQKVVVVDEGPESELFETIDDGRNGDGEGDGANPKTADDGVEDLQRSATLQRLGNNFQDRTLDELRAAGVEVDDDNEPVEENIPQPGQAAMPQGMYAPSWGHDGIDFRRTAGAVDSNAL